MKIKKINIKGYKRFFDLTIDLGDNPKRIIALVGPNGCGKSSVFDALLYRSSAYGAIGNKGTKDFNYHSLNSVSTLNHNQINIEFDIGTFDNVFQKRAEQQDWQTVFSFRSPYRYNGVLKITSTTATPAINLNNYGASFSADLDDKMENNYRRINSTITRYFKENNCTWTAAKAAIIGLINQSLKNCLDLEIQDVGDIEDNRGTLYFTKSDQIIPFEFNVLSSGEKEVVDILIDLHVRKDAYKNTIYLIDEPELHINTSIQRKLLTEINKIIGPDCQIWISTHSIGFLRALQDELKHECQIIQFHDAMNYATLSYNISPMKNSSSQWRNLFRTALDDLSHLVSPKTIIYCEGQDKPGSGGAEKGLDAKIYNTIFNTEIPDALFVSSGGNTELDQRSGIAIAIMSKVFPTVEILVFKDRDVAPGNLMSQQNRIEYLHLNPTNHRMLNRREIENYLFDKEILMAYCAGKSYQFDETIYASMAINIIDDDIKAKISQVKKSCGITFSINKEIFKQELAPYITPDTAIYKELKECIFPNAIRQS